MSDALSVHLRDWDAQRAKRIELGDDLAAQRMIDHAVVFRRKRSARSAAAAFEAKGFTVVLIPGLFRTTVEASRVDSLTEASVASILSEAIEIADAYGGLYDGFGGTIVPESDEG